MRMRTAGRLVALSLAMLAIPALASCSQGGTLTRNIIQQSTSMEPTVHEGDVIKVTRVANGSYVPHRGDIILFVAPDGWLDPSNAGACDCLLKRVIGIPGDQVSSDGDGYPVMVNGTALNEPYLSPDDVPSMVSFQATVPSDGLWVMGDNRAVSLDSREHQAVDGKGFIPVDSVIGVYRAK